MSYRLGLPLFEPGDCGSSNCDKQYDIHGDHALHCRDDSGLKGGRHDRIRDNIFKEAQHASLNPTKEMPGLVPNSQSRPADVYIANWIGGRKTDQVIRVVSPTQESIVLHAADYPSAAIETRKSAKIRTH